MIARKSVTARKPMKARKSKITRLIQVIDAPDVGLTTSFHSRATVPYHIWLQIQHSSVLVYITHVEGRHEFCPTILRLGDPMVVAIIDSSSEIALQFAWIRSVSHFVVG